MPTRTCKNALPTWLAGALLTGLGFLLSFGLLEAGFRIHDGVRVLQQEETWAIFDPEVGYRLNPKYGDTNPDGLRDHPITPKAGRFRVLMLGDSVAYYGDDIDDTYVGRLRTRLAHDPDGPPLDVVNAGIKGYTNYQELVFLKKYGLKFEPDLVGVGFVLNDLHRTLHQFQVRNGRIVGQTYDFTPDAVQSVDSWLYRLARKSVFLRWLWRRLSIANAAVELTGKKGFSFDYRPDFNTAWKDASWPAIESQLREMTELGVTHGFRVFVVVFPFGEQYREDYLARDREYVLKPQRKLAVICGRFKISCLDLYSQLNRSAHLEEDNIHLTKAGRARVAEVLAAFLKAERLVPLIPRPLGVAGKPRS